MLYFNIFIALSLFYVCRADILGCGGYVKSDVEIKYAEVGIKLYTNQGNLKYETDCAPNNGYYFIPLYDKGEYILKVAPPPGWSFEPNEVKLKVDGETDPCFLGQDINFHFKGFAVIGKVVSEGSDSGPSKVTVKLIQEGKVLLTTETSEGGNYVFTPLASGTFTVVASHPTWSFKQDKVTVEVTDKNGDTGNSLIVSGYSISGQVKTEGKPTSGVRFALHSQIIPKNKLDCNYKEPKHYENSVSMPFICHVTSDSNGQFKFKGVSPGSYVLVSYHQSETTKYEVVPKKLDITVPHGDLVIEEQFKVDGFSVEGKVLSSKGGVGLADANVVLDHGSSVDTDSKGLFVFHRVKSGSHVIEITSDKYQFEKKQVVMSADNPQIPDFYPSKYEVCFIITLEKTELLERSWEIIVETTDRKSKFSKKGTKDSDRCFFLPKGEYSAHVVLPDFAKEAGVRFGPTEHIFTVSSEPINDIIFSQFLGVISGVIKCLRSCGDLSVTLKPVRGESGGGRNMIAKDGIFAFNDVIPGAYVLSVHKEEWCWDQKSVSINVNTQDVDVKIQHTGYKLTISASHNTELFYKSSKIEEGSLMVLKGTTQECLSKPGVYTFTPKGCHKFVSSEFKWDTQSPSLLTLSSTKHLFTAKIDFKDLITFTLDVKQPNKNKLTLKPVKTPKETDGFYLFEHYFKEGESIVITPSAQDNLYQFEPTSFSFTMPDNCLENAVIFKPEKALFIDGSVDPPIEGVTIHVKGNGQTHTFETDAKGKYVAGPLDKSGSYSISAEKTGYKFEDAKEKGTFLAFKLGEISVKVEDEDGNPLNGVLISTSGGTNYKKNSLTGSDGAISFYSLMPGDYFLRPIMKEYTFDPSSKMVSIIEGETINLLLKGSRVAYSVYGQTVSLSGEHETDVTVEAVGKSEDCQQYQEEAVSDQKGYFRIRGLIPKCEYDLRLKKGEKINENVQRSLPAIHKVVINNQDIKDLRLIVLRPFLQMDVSVMVKTSPEYLSSLVAHLYRDDLPDTPVHTVKLSNQPYFLFPPMLIDNRSYTLQLKSSLSSSQYKFKNKDISFKGDSSFKHLQLDFNPTFHNVDAEMNQGTVAGIFMSFALVVLAYNYKSLGPFYTKLTEGSSGYQTNTSSNTNTFFDSPEIELVKKRAKAKKI